MENLCKAIVLAPLVGAVIAGLFCRVLNKKIAHGVTILGVGISFVLSCVVFYQINFQRVSALDFSWHTWLVSGNLRLEIGFLVDPLTAIMITVVSFVSLIVHIYTIGYMRDDPGYQRFFSYISLFTFSMLMLVMSNNFLQLFFGWEAVGLMSYLLIGFWFTRETAVIANFKAFIVNRIGDFGFILGIAAIVYATHSLDYQEVFAQAIELDYRDFAITTNFHVELITLICIFLFIGAMGKSAQAPLHIWLPDSMEGPTPISALIHAATMVTAGIFMVARMSPLFEYSQTALSFVLVIGALTAFFMGLVAIVQTDIKRVIAYSTLSQLGYMTVALGASAYPEAIFHLFTHAFFKALLFLAAGSVIIALHHEQDMRNMGGLRKKMPITYLTALVGTLALIGFPGFSGFYSKDAVIEAVHHAVTPGAQFAYWLVLAGVFITALYSFRLIFMVFHGQERFAHHSHATVHESPLVVTLPLILLAVPSLIAGYFIGHMVFGSYFQESILQLETQARNLYQATYHGLGAFTWHGILALPFWLMLSGSVCAWYFFLYKPEHSELLKRKFSLLRVILEQKYGFDLLAQYVLAPLTRRFGQFLSDFGDRFVIDGLIVNGSAKSIGWFSSKIKNIQSGYLYHYAFVMVVGLLFLLTRLFFN